ncbi:AAA domain-containing protein, partial [Candidatus Poribacteria bacterium]|nr:AAA domain-containing protein [Candidatus Poribacteria bacterium]
AIHNRDKYRDGDFVAVNCAALPENLLESELFGHEQGAFTGAIERRIGKFELANKGTLLLDEIAEMAPSLQAKLLRVLQEEEIDRVGGTKPIKVDVRVVATTNRNIEKEIKEGNFRGDLYYRLDVIPIVVPPLRNRHRDIKILALYFLDKFSSQIGKKTPDVSKKALNALENYNWPGNVRELENVIKRAVMLCQGSELSVRNFFPDKISSIHSENWIPVGISLQEMEKHLILKTLESVGGNRTKAADILGITTRTIRNKLQQYSEGDSTGKGD